MAAAAAAALFLASPFSRESFSRRRRRLVVLCWDVNAGTRYGMIALRRYTGLPAGKYSSDSLQHLQEDVDSLGLEGRGRVECATLAALLRECGNAKSLPDGRKVHAYIIKGGNDRDTFLANLLIQMYGKCGSLADASSVFDKMGYRNLFSWNIMFSVYAQNGQLQEARNMFDNMPNRNVVSWNSIIACYAQNGQPEEARSLFNKMPERNLVSWNAIIAAYTQNEHPQEAIQLFKVMGLEGIHPDKISFLSAIDACASLSALADGKAAHVKIVESGLESDIAVANALVTMYGKCARLKDAQSAFDRIVEPNVVSWTALVAANAQNGHLQHAAALFEQMPQRNVVSWTAMITAHTQTGQSREALVLFRRMDLDGVQPDKVTFVSVIDACANFSAPAVGVAIHEEIIDSGVEQDVAVGNALVNMYGKCGMLEVARRIFDRMESRNVVSWTAIVAALAQNGHLQDARGLFDKMPHRNVVSWNAMITAYAHMGDGKEALKLFRRMLLDGMHPDKVTFMSTLDACAGLTSVVVGKLIHACVTETGLQSDIVVGTALLNMYAKCGCLDDALSMFRKLPQSDVVSWSALITAYAQNGHGKVALEIFQAMHVEGVQPNDVTFVSVLSACSHVGLVEDGWQYLFSMSQDHELVPTDEHFVCMVDILGRAGRLSEAEGLIECMPFEPPPIAWKSLLSCCKLYNDVKRAERIAKLVFELDPVDSSPHVMMCNIYSAAGKWKKAAKLRREMEESFARADDEDEAHLPGECKTSPSSIQEHEDDDDIELCKQLSPVSATVSCI